MANSSFAKLHELIQVTRRHRKLTSDTEAFVHLFLERILHLSDDAIKVAVTHGPADGGIDALHHYWNKIESTHIPHNIYLVTNREHSGIDRDAIQRQMNYYQSHSYHYFDQADLVAAYH